MKKKKIDDAVKRIEMMREELEMKRAELLRSSAAMSALERRHRIALESNERLRKELEEANEKYAVLLRKHIDMMERCVGIIPKIRKPDDEG